MQVIGLGKTDPGQRRDHNEDAFLVAEEIGLFAVSDGMGGHAAGEVASRTALAAVVMSLQAQGVRLQEIATQPEGEGLDVLAREAALAACKAVYEKARSEPRYAGMGCTLTLLLTAGSNAVMAHVGDSRLYLLRDGTLHQLSTDHTLANEMVSAGVLPKEKAAQSRLSHVLSRAIGTQASVQVDTLVMPLLQGDRFLLCSDGLHNYLDDDAWLSRTLGEQELGALPEHLIDFANESGGHDNITAIVVGVEAASAAAHSQLRRTEIELRLAALDSVFLFSELPLSHRLKVLGVCSERDLSPGQRLFGQGEPCAGLAMVLEGRLSVARRTGGRGEAGVGENIGVSSLLHPRHCFADVVAIDRCRVLLLQREAFLRLVRGRPWLGIHLLERLGRHLSQVLDQRNAEWDAAHRKPSIVPPEGGRLF